MNMVEYETITILTPDISDEAVHKNILWQKSIIESEKGKLIKASNWGKKRLAYEIKKHFKGVYLHLNFFGSTELIKEYERKLNLSDMVMRFLTVKLNDKVSAEEIEKAEGEIPDLNEITSNLGDKENNSDSGKAKHHNEKKVEPAAKESA